MSLNVWLAHETAWFASQLICINIVQMFLHPQNEVPMITDLGFAVPPGRHSVIAVKASEVQATFPCLLLGI